MKKRLISAALAALLLVGAPASVFAGSAGSNTGGPTTPPVLELGQATLLTYSDPTVENTNWSGAYVGYSAPKNFYIAPSTEKYGEYAVHWNDQVYPAVNLVPFKTAQTFQIQTPSETTSHIGYGQFCSVEIENGKSVEIPIVQEGKGLVVLQGTNNIVFAADVDSDGSPTHTITTVDNYAGDIGRIADFSWEKGIPATKQKIEVTNRRLDYDSIDGSYVDYTANIDALVYQVPPSMKFSIASHASPAGSLTVTIYDQVGEQKYKQRAEYQLYGDGLWYKSGENGSYCELSSAHKGAAYEFNWKAEKGTLYNISYFRFGSYFSGGSYYFQVVGEHETPIDPTEPDEPDEPEVVQPAPGPQPDGSYVVNSDTEISGFTLSMTLPADSEIAAPSATFTPVGNTPKALAAQLAADKSQLMQLVDIQLLDGGVPVTSTLQTPVDITFYSTEITASTPLTVYRSESDGSFSALGTSAQGKGFATFRTNHFSLYGLARRQLNTGRSGGGSTGFSAYWITAEAGPNGSISPAGETKVAFGDSLTVTVTPDAGYAVDKVLIDGTKEVALTDGKYTFQNVNEPYTIKATFKKASGTAETPAPDEKPETPAAAPNPATGDSWFANLFDGLFN